MGENRNPERKRQDLRRRPNHDIPNTPLRQDHHVKLDHHHCLESIILKGKVKELEKLGSHIASLKGVKLSKINLIADCPALP
jgi:hypothetical protein